jgi:RHS repeat-associated protein
LNRLATVTVNGMPTSVNLGLQFEALLPLANGMNTAVVEATAVDGAVTSEEYQFEKNQALAYDENGNMTSDGSRIISWDSENRLVQVTDNNTSPATVTTMLYDGFSRRSGIKETQGSATLATKVYVWDRITIAEERSAFGVVSKRYFSNGFQNTKTSFFSSHDHLGSVVDVTDPNGNLRGAYSFDLWGRRTRLAGDINSDFGFTGHFQDEGTGLTLAWFRNYEPNLGRWLSRDPIGERGGMNLYGYVGNRPVQTWDPFGLSSCLDLLRNVDLNDSCAPDTGKQRHQNWPGGVSVNDLLKPASIPMWINNVKPGGTSDFKTGGAQYENIGNFAYGVTGYVNGIPGWLLKMAAGIVQMGQGHSQADWLPMFYKPPYNQWGNSWGDDPRDQYYVQKGIDAFAAYLRCVGM